jgi:hypothetical protein
MFGVALLPSRPGRNRTHNLLFWRQALYQLSYWPLKCAGGSFTRARTGYLLALLCLAVERMLPAMGAVFVHFETIWIIAFILF